MRKICIITGTRAEYGLLYWLMKEIQEDADLELQIIATGMHLSPEFGLTYRQIEEDRFKIDKKIEMLLSSDTSVGISKEDSRGIYWPNSGIVASSPMPHGQATAPSLADVKILLFQQTSPMTCWMDF